MTMLSPVDEIRALAAKALTDAEDEARAASDAVIRCQANIDKAYELTALANRIDSTAENPIQKRIWPFLSKPPV